MLHGIQITTSFPCPWWWSTELIREFLMALKTSCAFTHDTCNSFRSYYLKIQQWSIQRLTFQFMAIILSCSAIICLSVSSFQWFTSFKSHLCTQTSAPVAIWDWLCNSLLRKIFSPSSDYCRLPLSLLLYLEKLKLQNCYHFARHYNLRLNSLKVEFDFQRFWIDNLSTNELLG